MPGAAFFVPGQPEFARGGEKTPGVMKNSPGTPKKCPGHEKSHPGRLFLSRGGEKTPGACGSKGFQNISDYFTENIDHIVLTKNFSRASKPKNGCWNEIKNLSDHKGAWIEIID